MSHCLNEVKSVTLINCRNNLIFIIVVCDILYVHGTKKEKFSKIRPKIFDDILLVFLFRSRDYRIVSWIGFGRDHRAIK